MNTPLLDPKTESTSTNRRYMTVIHNNETNSVDEVVNILMVATGCGAQEAMTETWEAHHYGKAPVHFASEKECRRIAEIVETIGVLTTVQPEWDD